MTTRIKSEKLSFYFENRFDTIDMVGFDLHIVKNNSSSITILGIVKSSSDNEYILKTWGSRGELGFGLDTHYLNQYNRIKIVGVDYV